VPVGAAFEALLCQGVAEEFATEGTWWEKRIVNGLLKAEYRVSHDDKRIELDGVIFQFLIAKLGVGNVVKLHEHLQGFENVSTLKVINKAGADVGRGVGPFFDFFGAHGAHTME
jgi:hypothetical protein